jgi:hypothetical protein
MARKTSSLLPLLVRLLIAAAIAGVLAFCSLAIERTKEFFNSATGLAHTPSLGAVLVAYRRGPSGAS